MPDYELANGIAPTAVAATPGSSTSKVVKDINRYIRLHPFFRSESDEFTTSQRRAFERNVYDYARAKGLSAKEAQQQVTTARRLCIQEEIGGGNSAFEDEVDDSKAILGSLDARIGNVTPGNTDSDIDRRAPKSANRSVKRKGSTPHASKFFNGISPDKTTSAALKRKLNFDELDAPTVPSSPKRHKKSGSKASGKTPKERLRVVGAVSEESVPSMQAEAASTQIKRKSLQEKTKSSKEERLARKAAKKAAKEERKTQAEAKKLDQKASEQPAQEVQPNTDSSAKRKRIKGNKVEADQVQAVTLADKSTPRSNIVVPVATTTTPAAVSAEEAKKISQQQEKEQKEKRAKFLFEVMRQRNQAPPEPAESLGEPAIPKEVSKPKGYKTPKGEAGLKPREDRSTLESGRGVENATDVKKGQEHARKSDEKKSKKRKSTGAVTDESKANAPESYSKKDKERRKSSGDEPTKAKVKKEITGNDESSKAKKAKKKAKKDMNAIQEAGF